MQNQRGNREKGNTDPYDGNRSEGRSCGSWLFWSRTVYSVWEELSAGMVGYITASLKNVKDTRVGDTLTDAGRPCAEPLPGYKKSIRWYIVDCIRQTGKIPGSEGCIGEIAVK